MAIPLKSCDAVLAQGEKTLSRQPAGFTAGGKRTRADAKVRKVSATVRLRPTTMLKESSSPICLSAHERSFALDEVYKLPDAMQSGLQL